MGTKNDFEWMLGTASKLYRHGKGLEVRQAATEAVRQAGINEPEAAQSFKRAICSALGKRGAERKKAISENKKRVEKIWAMQKQRRELQAAAAKKAVVTAAPTPQPQPKMASPGKPTSRTKKKALRHEGQIPIAFP